jgi:hypothetical protein
MRLALYYGVVVTVMRNDLDMLVIPVAAAGVTYLLYSSFGKRGAEKFEEPWQRGECVKPTKDNPFMNMSPADDPEKRVKSCDPLDPGVSRAMDETFKSSMFYDIDDVWSRNNAGRNFYTMPVTAVPNDQTDFAEWLYSGVRAGGKQTRPPRNAIY